MYIDKVSKVSPEEARKYRNAPVGKIGANVLLVDDYLEAPSLYKDIFPFFTKIRVIRKECNYEKMAEDLGTSVYQIGEIDVSKEYVSIEIISESNPDASKVVKIPRSQYDSYLSQYETDAYVWHSETIATWGKDYGLRDLIHKNHEAKCERNYLRTHSDLSNYKKELFEIKNLGYYKLSSAERKAIARYQREKYEFIQGEEDLLDKNAKNLFFQEWY